MVLADKDAIVFALMFRLLVLFCCINLLNYLDRGTIASNGVNGVPGDAGCLKDETCFHGSGIQYVIFTFSYRKKFF